MTQPSRVRYLIVAILFAVSCFSYGDRVALSLAGTAMAKDISLDPVKMGYLFSGFSWAYVLGQLPSGALLDRFGSKLIYGIGIVVWSICALLTGFAGYLAAGAAFTVIFLLRLVAGFAQAPPPPPVFSPGMAASSPPGSPPMSAEGLRQSSMLRNTLR